MTINERLQNEFNMSAEHVDNTVALLDEGATVPFIARYRKDHTGNMDDQAVRSFADRLTALRKLEERRADVHRLIEEQGKL
ncbi:MAG: Tex-like N-terminal domain-containing protein, partial [Peptococcaceae bacterium]|nr:Tex-like N-terminal domain-containing protein [Peptococcaceae bacterium]